MEGQRKLESDGGGKYNWSWSPEQGKSDGEKPYLRCQGDERTGGDGERKETIGVDFFGRRGPIGRPSPFGAIIYRKIMGDIFFIHACHFVNASKASFGF